MLSLQIGGIGILVGLGAKYPEPSGFFFFFTSFLLSIKQAKTLTFFIDYNFVFLSSYHFFFLKKYKYNRSMGVVKG